jgi:hypothetical protein
VTVTPLGHVSNFLVKIVSFYLDVFFSARTMKGIVKVCDFHVFYGGQESRKTASADPM